LSTNSFVCHGGGLPIVSLRLRLPLPSLFAGNALGRHARGDPGLIPHQVLRSLQRWAERNARPAPIGDEPDMK
jgi:hypothetical protein